MTQHGQPLPGGPRPWLGPWGPLNRGPIHNRPRTGWEEGWGRGALHPYGPSPHVHSAPRKMRRGGAACALVTSLGLAIVLPPPAAEPLGAITILFCSTCLGGALLPLLAPSPQRP